MGLWVNIGILTSVILAAVIGVTVAIIKYSKEEEFFDEPIGINFMSHYCDGRFLVVEKKTELGKEGRQIITGSPRDVNPYEFEKAHDVKIVVDKNKLISLPKGIASRDKNINIYLPPTLDSFPKALKETLFGKLLMFLTVITDSDNAEIDAFKTGMKRQMAHVRSMSAGEVSLEKINQIEEIYMDLLDAAKDSKRDNKFPSSGINPPR